MPTALAGERAAAWLAGIMKASVAIPAKTPKRACLIVSSMVGIAHHSLFQCILSNFFFASSPTYPLLPRCKGAKQIKDSPIVSLRLRIRYRVGYHKDVGLALLTRNGRGALSSVSSSHAVLQLDQYVDIRPCRPSFDCAEVREQRDRGIVIWPHCPRIEDAAITRQIDTSIMSQFGRYCPFAIRSKSAGQRCVRVGINQ